MRRSLDHGKMHPHKHRHSKRCKLVTLKLCLQLVYLEFERAELCQSAMLPTLMSGTLITLLHNHTGSAPFPGW